MKRPSPSLVNPLFNNGDALPMLTSLAHEHGKEAERAEPSRLGTRYAVLDSSSFIKGGDSRTNLFQKVHAAEIAGYRSSQENEVALNNLFTDIAWLGGHPVRRVSP